MSNNWINFVKDYARRNNMSYKDALRYAKSEYQGGRQGSYDAVQYQRGDPYAEMRVHGAGPMYEDENYKIGYYVGNILAGGAKSKGALTSLLSGLNARITID